jgi:tetratricopeptide (TPR) repeat protein
VGIRALFCLLVLLGGGAARAQVDDPSGSARARQLSDEGLAQLGQGHFAQAIEEFQASFALEPKPPLLFNIALAYRRLGECEQALIHYRRYLDMLPEAPNRAKVEARIAEMESCAQEHTPPATAAPVTVAPAPTAPAPAASVKLAPRAGAAPVSPPTLAPPLRTTSARHRGRGLALGALASGAVGAGALAAAIYFSVDGQQAADGLSRLVQTPGWNTTSEQQFEARGRRDNLAAGVLYGVGGAGLLAGAALLGVDVRVRRTAVVFLSPASGGALVSCAVPF